MSMPQLIVVTAGKNRDNFDGCNNCSSFDAGSNTTVHLHVVFDGVYVVSGSFALTVKSPSNIGEGDRFDGYDYSTTIWISLQSLPLDIENSLRQLPEVEQVSVQLVQCYVEGYCMWAATIKFNRDHAQLTIQRQTIDGSNVLVTVRRDSIGRAALQVKACFC